MVTLLLIPVAALFIAALFVVRYNGKPAAKLLADPTAELHASPLLGFFSNVGVIAWCAGASVAGFTAWSLWSTNARREVVRFHALAGAFTTVLLLDDFFMIHDDLAWRYLHLGQSHVYAVYIALFMGFLGICRREIMERNPALLVLSVGLLGFMAGADAVHLSGIPRLGLAMSGSKLLGIFAWASWLILAARRDITSVPRAPVS